MIELMAFTSHNKSFNIMDQNNNNSMHVCDSSGCRCTHHIVAPIAAILIGVAFILQAAGWLSPAVVSYAWPVLLIIAAAGKLCKCCR